MKTSINTENNITPILSKREKEVLGLIGWGASIKDVSAVLNIAEDTVRMHVKSIKRKIGLQKMNEISAYMFVVEYGIPIQEDLFGRIRKVLSVAIVITLIIVADYMNIDFNRANGTRANRTIRTARKGGRKSDTYDLTDDELKKMTA